MEKNSTTSAACADPVALSKFEYDCEVIRKSIKGAGQQVRDLHARTRNSELSTHNNYSEMDENIVIAFRCLEDAAMRLGKAMQAYQSGYVDP